MQDLLDVSIPAVVLVPLFIVFFAVWRCIRWMVQSQERSRAEFVRLHRLAKEEQERAERDHELGYGSSYHEYRRQRPGGLQRQRDDYRVEYGSQPAGYEYPRREYGYGDILNFPSRQDEETMRRRRWDEERRRAEAEEVRIRQAEEYNRRKQAEVEELRRVQARAEEAERNRREAAGAEVRRIQRLAEEAEAKRRAEEEERRKRQAEEEEMRRRQAEEEEMRKRQAEKEEKKRRLAEEEERRRVEDEEERRRQAELQAQARKMADEEAETKKQEAEESIQEGTLINKVYMKLQSPSKLRCIVCQKQTKRRCSRCKSVFYCSRECQVQHWNEGHKFNCRTLESSGSPGSSESGARKFSDLLSPRSSRSDEITAPSLSPAISPAPSPAPSPALMYDNSAVSHSAPVSPQPGSLLKTSSTVSADGRRLKPKKILFPYGDFVELFNTDITFIPCGLINYGNSCFANAVLQCLTYTQPLVAYLLRGDHRRHCRIVGWCFMCALQEHAVRVKQLRSAFTPVDIVSHLRNIGRSLGYGKQEDAHEFMSYAIHLMQNICLGEVGGEKAVDACTQETTLIHHIFGGLLRSQVRCMECGHESNVYEVTMDLAVEIHGNVGSLEDALRQFTAPETLDGENKYKCDWCDAYAEARKQITVHEAPNILIVTLKRFKPGSFGKLNKQVAFSDVLDMTPYMSENGDKPPIYTLYAIVVHVDLDALNAADYGHYICLVKNPRGYWYRVDDPKVTEVDIYRVKSQQAYILFYKRSNSRPKEFAENTLCRNSRLAQDWIVSNSFELRPEPYQFPLQLNPLVSSTRTDRTDFIHVPIRVSNCC